MKRFLPDLILVAIALAVMLPFALPRFTKDASPAEAAAVSETRPVSVVLRAAGLEFSTQQGIDTEALVGAKLTSGDATVASCTWAPHEESVWAADGVTHRAEDPVRRDLILTLSAEITGDPVVYKLDGQEIRMGRGFHLTLDDLYLDTVIESFERD